MPVVYQCPHCQATSHGQGDMINLYCGRCHRFEPAALPNKALYGEGRQVARIISDGTAHGTHLLDAEGKRFLQGASGISAIEIEPIVPNGFVTAQVTFFNISIDIAARLNEQAFARPAPADLFADNLFDKSPGLEQTMDAWHYGTRTRPDTPKSEPDLLDPPCGERGFGDD